MTTAEGKINGLESFQSTTSSWITNTDEEISSIKTNHTSLAGRVTTAEGQIATKVDTSTFNTLSHTVSENSSTITQLSETVDEKADGSTVTTLSNTVNTLSQTVSGNSSSISTLQQTVSDQGTTISRHSTEISNNADAIALKANSSDVYTTTQIDGKFTTEATNRSNEISNSAAGTLQTIAQTYATKTMLEDAEGDIETLESRVSTAETNISKNATDITYKANSSDVYTKTAVDGLMTTEVTNRNNAISTSAAGITETISQTYATKTELEDATDDISALDSRVTTAESSISRNATNISYKANSSDVYTKTAVDGLITTEVTNRNNAISASAEGITETISETYATKTALQDAEGDITALDSRMTSAESSISRNASNIELKVSSTDYTGANIISRINLAPSSAIIESEHIELDGNVVMKSNLTDGTTTISGSNITTGTIDATTVSVTNIDASNINSGTLSADYIDTGSMLTIGGGDGNGQINITDTTIQMYDGNGSQLLSLEGAASTRRYTNSEYYVGLVATNGKTEDTSYHNVTYYITADTPQQVDSIKYTPSGKATVELPSSRYSVSISGNTIGITITAANQQ